MRFLLLAAFLYCLSILFQVPTVHKTPVKPNHSYEMSSTLLRFDKFRLPSDSFFISSEGDSVHNAFIRLLVILSLEKLSDSGVAHYLLMDILGYERWNEVFKHFSLSLWYEGEKSKFLLVIPWARINSFDRLLASSDDEDLLNSQGLLSRQWNAGEELFIKKHGQFLLISNSQDRVQSPVSEGEDGKVRVFFYSDTGSLNILGLPGISSIDTIEGKSVGEGEKSSIEFKVRLKESTRNDRWLTLFQAGQSKLHKEDRNVVQIQCSIPSLINEPEVRQRLAKASPKQAPAMKWIVEALSGTFGIHGYFEDGRAQGSLTMGFSSPGSSGQAIEKIESLLHLRGGVLAKLDGSGNYSISLPFLPVTLFLSRNRDLLSLSTASSWQASQGGIISDPGFLHGFIILEKIAGDLEKGMLNFKEQYHIRKLRQCLQIRRLETGIFRKCPLGPNFKSAPEGLECALHGSMASPGSVLARDHDQRFMVFSDFLKAFQLIYVHGLVEDKALKFKFTNHFPSHQK